MAPKNKTPICNRCGHDHGKIVAQCVKCGSTKFAPSWIVALRPLNRQVSVQISKPNPTYGEAPDRITLSKWWPGGRASYHISNVAQWEQIMAIIENDLGPKLGWKSAHQAAQEAGDKEIKGSKKKLGKIFEERPDLIRKIVESIDPDSLSKKDFETLSATLAEISSTVSSASAGFRDAFLAVIQKLPKQKQKALEDLALLLQGWSLQAVTNVAQQVRSRLDTIQLFEERIQDPRTFEIRGENSIHRILERALWLVDERYWLLHSNEPLRKFIGDEMTKRDKKKYGDLRPDFVCGNVGNKLIILELKRPAHTLEVEDLNQLEEYIIIAESYSDFSSYEAYLIGNKKSDALAKTLKHRSSNFKTYTYSDLLADTKKKYEKFLKSLDT